MTALCMDLDARDLAAKPLRRRPAEVVSAASLPSDLVYRRGARELLLRWPSLRALIPEAFQKLREFFGSTARIELQRFDDPEAEEGVPSLYLVVLTNKKALAARESMDRFQDDWWLDNAERGDDHLHISVRFL